MAAQHAPPHVHAGEVRQQKLPPSSPLHFPSLQMKPSAHLQKYSNLQSSLAGDFTWGQVDHFSAQGSPWKHQQTEVFTPPSPLVWHSQLYFEGGGRRYGAVVNDSSLWRIQIDDVRIRAWEASWRYIWSRQPPLPPPHTQHMSSLLLLTLSREEGQQFVTSCLMPEGEPVSGLLSSELVQLYSGRYISQELCYSSSNIF